jgi:outer membrane protein assembly factor BamA
VFRTLVEGVSGDAEDIPFTHLPQLGGALLRGHAKGQYRDRWLSLATAEYRYPVNESMLAALFVDAGQVWHSPGDVSTDGLADTKVGFGVGLQLHSMRSYVGRVDLSFSPDGDAFVVLELDPVTHTISRGERK